MIKVAVCGANGKMGQEVVKAVTSAEDMKLVAKIDIVNGEYDSIESAHNNVSIDVLVDFTQPKSIYENAKYCLNNNINIVVGTTGLNDEQLKELENLSNKNKTACFVAPNFSTGAVLMMMFAKTAARGANSYKNIHIHSVRMPGYMASQEVLFGANGQILSIRHDSTNRECYMPGVLLSIRYVMDKGGFVYGLDNIM